MPIEVFFLNDRGTKIEQTARELLFVGLPTFFLLSIENRNEWMDDRYEWTCRLNPPTAGEAVGGSVLHKGTLTLEHFLLCVFQLRRRSGAPGGQPTGYPGAESDTHTHTHAHTRTHTQNFDLNKSFLFVFHLDKLL